MVILWRASQNSFTRLSPPSASVLVCISLCFRWCCFGTEELIIGGDTTIFTDVVLWKKRFYLWPQQSMIWEQYWRQKAGTNRAFFVCSRGLNILWCACLVALWQLARLLFHRVLSVSHGDINLIAFSRSHTRAIERGREGGREGRRWEENVPIELLGNSVELIPISAHPSVGSFTAALILIGQSAFSCSIKDKWTNLWSVLDSDTNARLRVVKSHALAVRQPSAWETAGRLVYSHEPGQFVVWFEDFGLTLLHGRGLVSSIAAVCYQNKWKRPVDCPSFFRLGVRYYLHNTPPPSTIPTRQY